MWTTAQMGVALHRGGLAATEAERRRGATRPVWGQVYALDGSAETAAGEALVPALHALAERIGRRYLPVRVAVPDPLVTLRVFELEAVPASGRARRELAAWRLARELDVPAETLACTHQYLGQEDGKHLLLACAAPAPAIEDLRTRFREAGLFLAHADTAAAHRLNAIADQGEPHLAWLVLEPDYWTLTLCDAQMRPRHMRSRWRRPGISAAEEAADVLEEVERVLLAYVHGAPGREVRHLRVSAARAEREALAAQLAARPWAELELPGMRDADGSFASMAAASWR